MAAILRPTASQASPTVLAATVLGVEPTADAAAVRAAYRRAVRVAHPDAGGSAAAFRVVRAAYETLLAATAAPAPVVIPVPRAA